MRLWGASVHGGTPKTMVYFMEHPIKLDDWGSPRFWETSISVSILKWSNDLDDDWGYPQSRKLPSGYWSIPIVNDISSNNYDFCGGCYFAVHQEYWVFTDPHTRYGGILLISPIPMDGTVGGLKSWYCKGMNEAKALGFTWWGKHMWDTSWNMTKPGLKAICVYVYIYIQINIHICS